MSIIYWALSLCSFLCVYLAISVLLHLIFKNILCIILLASSSLYFLKMHIIPCFYWHTFVSYNNRWKNPDRKVVVSGSLLLSGSLFPWVLQILDWLYLPTVFEGCVMVQGCEVIIVGGFIMSTSFNPMGLTTSFNDDFLTSDSLAKHNMWIQPLPPYSYQFWFLPDD